MDEKINKVKSGIENYFDVYLKVNSYGGDVENDLSIVHIDEIKFVVMDTFTDQKILIKWESLLDKDLQSWCEEHAHELNDEFFWNRIFSGYDARNDNERMLFLPELGFCYRGYSEFFLNTLLLILS